MRGAQITVPGLGPGPDVRALQLRYQVYCIECNFLSPDDYPDGVETDEYDARSHHFYAFDDDDELVGYVRLVHAGAGERFPFQDRCTLLDGVRLPPSHEVAEISRLMIRNDFRRCPDDRLSGITAQQNDEMRAGHRRHESTRVLMTLYRQMFRFCEQQGLQYLYAAMERPLARSLKRVGVQFEAIGPQTDYYGPVAPYLMDIGALRRQIRAQDERLAWLREEAVAVERRRGTPQYQPEPWASRPGSAAVAGSAAVVSLSAN